jgi:hypothetical protein
MSFLQLTCDICDKRQQFALYTDRPIPRELFTAGDCECTFRMSRARVAHLLKTAERTPIPKYVRPTLLFNRLCVRCNTQITVKSTQAFDACKTCI